MRALSYLALLLGAGICLAPGGCWRGSANKTDGTPAAFAKAPPVVPRYDRAVDVQGDSLRQFRNALRIELNQAEQVLLYRENWRGPEDLGATVWLMHGRQTLYLAADVADDEVKYAGHPGEWSGDALNFLLKTETEEGVREFLFKFSCEGTRYCYFDRRANNGQELDWGESAATRTEQGYRLKAAIPFRNLGLIGAADYKIWFNVALEDNDKGAYLIFLGQSEGFLNAPEWLPLELGK